MAECTCPTVVITAKHGQISESTVHRIANELFASVELRTEVSISMRFGKHRDDCPCKSGGCLAGP